MNTTSERNTRIGSHGSFTGSGNTCVTCTCGKPVWWYIEMPPICPWCLRELKDETCETAYSRPRSELNDLIIEMELKMRFQEVQKMAKSLGVNPYRKKKIELIQAIQGAEDNVPCFGTARINDCGEQQCLWKDDCLKVNGSPVGL